MKNEEKLYKYLKEVSLPKIEAGSHKEYLRQKLKSEFREFAENRTQKQAFLKPLFKFSLTIAVLFIIIFAGYISLIVYKDISKKQEVAQSCLVTYIEGSAYLIDADNTEKDLALGDNLLENQFVKTEKDSIVELQIGDGSVVRVKENSRLMVAKLYKDREVESTKFELDNGKILAKPKKMNEGSSFEIETDSIAVGVRGTEFVVINENNITSVAVKKGIVNIKGKAAPDELDTIKDFDKKSAELITLAASVEINITENEKVVVALSDIKSYEERVNEELLKITSELKTNKDSKENIKNIIEKIKTETVVRIKEEASTILKKETVSDEEWKTLFNKEEFDKIEIRDAKTIQNENPPKKEFENIDMVKVKQGAYQIGVNDGEDDEKPVHLVNVKSFEISSHEITFDQYDFFCEATNRTKPDDNGWGRGKLPVINVSWYDAVEFCNWLSEKDGLTPCYKIDKTKKDQNNKSLDKYDSKKWVVDCDFNANGYRLPTEAEWEYAARGTTARKAVIYSGSNNADDVAWYGENAIDMTQVVGSKKPNQFGLYDMSGNVWEWCWDWYDDAYYKEKKMLNPQGADSGISRVLRGGSYKSDKNNIRISNRNFSHSPDTTGDFGFRIVKNGK